jgi:phage shock protein PspC (stress-responsive transcriptional regulator)
MTTPSDIPPGEQTTEAPPPSDGSAEDASAAAEPPRDGQPAPRRLTRSRTDQMIGGVAGGLAEYFDVDPTLVRIALVVLALASAGTAVVFYIGAWIIVPEGDGTSAAQAGPAAFATSRGPRSSSSGAWAGMLWGFVLIAAGAWLLLWRLDVTLPQWDIVASALLVLVGLLLIVEARKGLNGVLLAGAIVLTAALGIASMVNVTVGSGFGDRLEVVTQASMLEPDYSHAFGTLTVDLSRMELPEGTTPVEVSIAFGDLQVRLPEGVEYRVTGKVFFGSATLAGREWDGIAVQNTYQTPDYDSAARRIDLEVSVAFGSARIR